MTDIERGRIGGGDEDRLPWLEPVEDERPEAGVGAGKLLAAVIVCLLAIGLVMIRAFPRLRIRLVPRRLRYRRAHENALRQFLGRNVHRTTARTGILIFVSLAERYAEVVADSGIAARVPQSEWDQIVTRLIAAAREHRIPGGFVEAVEAAGVLLSVHFPPAVRDPNELDDHLVEI